MGWESPKHLFKIRKEIGRELSSTMFLETKRREAGPLGKSAVLQVCAGPQVEEHVVCTGEGSDSSPFSGGAAIVTGLTRLLGVRSRLCPAVPLGQQQ